MKKIILILFSVIVLTGCTKRISQSQKHTANIEVTDYAERLIILEKPAEKIIVMADNALVVLAQLNSINKVVAIDSKTKTNLDYFLASKISPEIFNLLDVGKTKSPNNELILSLDADLILFKGDKTAANTLQNKTGIPVVCIISKEGYDFNIYSIIGKLVGQEKQAKQIIDELQKEKENLEKQLGKIQTDKLQSAYIILQNAKTDLFRTQQSCQSLELARVKNIAATTKNINEWGVAQFSKEEFLNCNPQVIYLDYPYQNSLITIQKVIQESTFKFCDAYKNNLILKTHSYSAPKDYAFVIAEAYYYARNSYPDFLSENDYKIAINSIFKTCYGIEGYYEEWKNSLR